MRNKTRLMLVADTVPEYGMMRKCGSLFLAAKEGNICGYYLQSRA